MNTPQPIPEAIGSVDFRFLTPEEIKRLSVKRIENPVTFDDLLRPISGGLYDPALGASGNTPCATCNLRELYCPGHVGHIDLPTPVYHPTFMAQLFKLLRATCVYCYRFRLSRTEVNRYICKLQLIQHGLLVAAAEIDNIDVSNTHGTGDDSDESDDESSIDKIIQLRNSFVKKCIKAAEKADRERHGEWGWLGVMEKHESVAEARRNVIKEFFTSIASGRTCGNCKGLSPTYRRDKYVKIFKKPLTPKEKAKMSQGNFRAVNAVEIVLGGKNEKFDGDVDEGIADVDLSSNGEDEGQGESLDVDGDVVMEGDTSKTKNTTEPKATTAKEYMNPMEVKALLTLLFEKEQGILSLVYDSRSVAKKATKVTAEMFFLQTLLVPPNMYRPEVRSGDSAVWEATQNTLYKHILNSCVTIADIYRDIKNADAADSTENDMAENPPRRKRDWYDLQEAWCRLQDAVNSLIDTDRNPNRGPANKPKEDGVKQLLEKKEGMFRKHMMGKRVNFAGRSVISPDPNIETNEIGVPPSFAVKLTYPEPVTSYNFKEMQQAVINGFDKWPGATAIENENGRVVNLRTKTPDERLALANQLLAPSASNTSGARGKKVHRHITNGDVVLMNRQPTLHKPSIMGHRTRILLKEKTIRMHYANCNTYNADFDGDEMNMHFPQNEIARAEALQIADTDHQYLVATSGKPLRGLIQDHISVSVWMCNRDTFFDRGAYQQLVYNSIRPESGHIVGQRIETVPPAIIKPVALWTGKQVITTILKNIKPADYAPLTLTGKSAVPADRWGPKSEEGIVHFKDGIFITGILDKSQIGPSGGGFVHAIHEVYGHTVASKILSILSRLLTKFLNMWAFSCGMDDLRLTPTGEQLRKEKLEEAERVGLQVTSKYVGLEEQKPSDTDLELINRLEDVVRDDSKQAGLDRIMNKRSGELSSDITRACLPKGLVKQFPQNQMQNMTVSGAKGSGVNANLISCNLGQQVLEGRRVPIMVSGKSLPCFKPFESSIRAGGYVVSRFLSGISPQEYYFHAMAGREGLIDTAVKTSRSGYLQRCLIKGMEGLKVEYDTSVRDSDGSLVQFLYGEDGLDVTKQMHLREFKFLLQNLESEIAQLNYGDPNYNKIFDEKDVILKRMKKALKHAKANKPDCPDPVLASFNPGKYGFATSEKFFRALTSYLKTNPDGMVKNKENPNGVGNHKALESVLAMKYLKAVVDPGEAVGIVAGQSIGEPSTQMTLNTFHLAGHSAKNVTLGIPRLREIIMTASRNISTPAMTLRVNPEVSPEDGEQFAKAISIVTLAEIVDEVQVTERIGRGVANAEAKIINVQVKLFPSNEYIEAYAISIADVLFTLEKRFAHQLQSLIRKALGLKKDAKGWHSSVNKDVAKDIAKPVREHVVTEAEATMEAEQEAYMRARRREDGTPSQEPEEGQPAGGRTPSAGQVRPAEDDDDRDSEGEGEDDEDGTTNDKQKANRGQAISYGANDDEDNKVQTEMQKAAELDDMEGMQETEDEGFGGSSSGSSDDEGDTNKPQAQKQPTSVTPAEREARVMKYSEDVTRFRIDESSGEWCDITLEYPEDVPKILTLATIRKALQETVVQQIESLETCTYVPDEEITDTTTGKKVKIPVVHTVGVNLKAMQAFPHVINPNSISTNDITAMLDNYGVEACRATIIQELSGVFGGHGINVDNRHLTLVADFMTRGGGFSPFNRSGLKGSVSPFMKMSFETTVGFLADAVADGDWDDLSSPSSRIVIGRTSKVGTGSFDVLTQVPRAHEAG